ncbi:MAG TPA: FHA domain-containing protein, partial [Gemmatimonadales bacterium]|nr:FHA domain-containing protein [Gemmatimonadales bacterium]
PAPAPAPAPASQAPPEPPAMPAPAPAPGAGERLKDTVHGIAGAPRPSGGALATFLVKAGELKGQRLPVRTPVVNIGRADYNDLVLPDPSVSTAHAKLQRREGVWVLVDLDSTNGSFVDGERVKGEAPLVPGALVRLGDVQLVFEPSDEAREAVKGGGTRVIERFQTPPQSAPPAARSAPASPPAAPPSAPRGPLPGAPAPARPAPRKRPAAQPPEPQKGKGCGSSAALVIVGLAALVYWVLV